MANMPTRLAIAFCAALLSFLMNLGYLGTVDFYMNFSFQWLILLGAIEFIITGDEKDSSTEVS